MFLARAFDDTRRRGRLSGAIALVVLLLGAAALGAEENGPAPGELRLETERVVVFKDGHALFIKRAAGVADENGEVHTGEVPDAAVLGTVWALAAGQDSVLAMRAEWIESVERTEETTPCLTVLELLRANVDGQVTLELSEEQSVAGRLVEVLEMPAGEDALEAEPPPRLAPANPLSSTIRTLPGWGIARELERRGGELVIVEVERGARKAVPVARIRSVAGPDLVTVMKRVTEKRTRTKRLNVDLGPRAAGREVGLRLLYFAPNLRWIPTYRVGGDLEREARLSLQAEILNEAEEIRGAALDLVVGVPNFRFKDVVSPLTLEATMRQALQEAAPGLMSQSMSNVLAARTGEWRGDMAVSGAGSIAGLAPELAAGGEQDLFVYSVPAFSLGQGERATVGLWQDEVALRHLYTLDVRVVRNGRSGSGPGFNPGVPDLGDASPVSLSPHRVWHQLELSNEGEVPWTTGAALLMRGALPLGQELLTYTPPGGQTLVPVTVAVDVRGSHEEREIERIPDAATFARDKYALVRKEGTITLTSYRESASRVRVRVALGGKVENASPGGEIVINDFRPDDWEDQRYAINQHSDVTWEIELQPGETRQLRYTSSFYIR